jgi:hypothetical protein
MIRIAAPVIVVAVALSAAPALAQFGSPFPPQPRPPGDVPGGPFGFPNRQQEDAPAPPPSPPPPTPQRGPARAPVGVQSQPLPPPPGATAADPRPPARPLPQPANPPPPQPANTAPQPDDTVVTEAPTQKIPNERAIFTGLDKITGRIINFDAAINETVQFGALQVTPRACYTRPPTEPPNTDAFLEVDEVTLQGEIKRIFTGWMFAASPGLHAVEHPIYDVWLTDCKSPVAAPVAQQMPPAPTPAAAPAPPAGAPPARQRTPRQPAARAPAPIDPFQQR